MNDNWSRLRTVKMQQFVNEFWWFACCWISGSVPYLALYPWCMQSVLNVSWIWLSCLSCSWCVCLFRLCVRVRSVYEVCLWMLCYVVLCCVVFIVIYEFWYVHVNMHDNSDFQFYFVWLIVLIINVCSSVLICNPAFQRDEHFLDFYKFWCYFFEWANLK